MSNIETPKTDNTVQNYLLFAKDGLVVLPEGVVFQNTTFSQNGNDLSIDTSERQHIVIRRFFDDEILPSLMSSNGEMMSGIVAGLSTSLSNRLIKALVSIGVESIIHTKSPLT